MGGRAKKRIHVEQISRKTQRKTRKLTAEQISHKKRGKTRTVLCGVLQGTWDKHPASLLLYQLQIPNKRTKITWKGKVSPGRPLLPPPDPASTSSSLFTTNSFALPMTTAIISSRCGSSRCGCSRYFSSAAVTVLRVLSRSGNSGVREWGVEWQESRGVGGVLCTSTPEPRSVLWSSDSLSTVMYSE